jgi:hypothetical protein
MDFCNQPSTYAFLGAGAGAKAGSKQSLRRQTYDQKTSTNAPLTILWSDSCYNGPLQN